MHQRIVSSIALIGLFFVAGCGGNSTTNTQQPFRAIPIPVSSGFTSQVISSRPAMDRFLSTTSTPAWIGSDREAFLRAIEQSRVNFDKEALVLIQHGEGSSGILVSLDPPRLESNQFLSTIRRGGGVTTHDAVDYTFAFVVSKSQVDEVRIDVEGKEPINLPVPD